MSLVKDLIWGKKLATSRLEFKYAMLRGEFGLIIMAVGIFYIILDTSNGIDVFIPWYVLMIAMCGTSMIFNRRGYYMLATSIILIIINFLVYIFADVDHPDGGVFFYFMTSTMAGLTLMSYYKSRLGLVFALLPIVMGYVAYFTDFNVIPAPVYQINMVSINFLSNFTISLCATVFMLQFLLNRNEESEQSLVQQNELLEKANKELDHFVYSVSHDLRAPLSSILGLTNVYNLAKDDNEKTEIVKMIHERAISLDKFIREVLDYSRNTRLELRVQSVNVRAIVEEVVQSLLFIQGTEEIAININIDPALKVSTDRERMKVVLSNLISNALYYRDPRKKSVIDIKSSIENDQWVTIIRDNGIGIKPEHVNRIFEMFYKAHDRAQGTGLGLYIVKETLQRLSGDIEVDSKYGVETIFTIKLPLRA